MKLHKEYLKGFELATRIYLAFILFDYGLGKLNGDMFSNTTPDMLDKPLKVVDSFHLTWYWFSQNKYLGVYVGVIQMLGAILLLFNRTVLVGCLLLFPVLSVTLAIDISAVKMPELIARIAFYTGLLVWYCFNRRVEMFAAFKHLTSPNYRLTSSIRFRALAIASGIAIIILTEWLLLKTVRLIIDSL